MPFRRKVLRAITKACGNHAHEAGNYVFFFMGAIIYPRAPGIYPALWYVYSTSYQVLLLCIAHHGHVHGILTT